MISLLFEQTTEPDSARVLASKFSLSQYAVENMDYVIDYRLYNVGDKVPSVRGAESRHFDVEVRAFFSFRPR